MYYTTPLHYRVTKRRYGLDLMMRIFGTGIPLLKYQCNDVHPLRETEHPENIFRNMQTADDISFISSYNHSLSELANIVYDDCPVTMKPLSSKRKEYILRKKRKCL